MEFIQAGEIPNTRQIIVHRNRIFYVVYNFLLPYMCVLMLKKKVFDRQYISKKSREN